MGSVHTSLCTRLHPAQRSTVSLTMPLALIQARPATTGLVQRGRQVAPFASPLLHEKRLRASLAPSPSYLSRHLGHAEAFPKRHARTRIYLAFLEEAKCEGLLGASPRCSRRPSLTADEGCPTRRGTTKNTEGSPPPRKGAHVPDAISCWTRAPLSTPLPAAWKAIAKLQLPAMKLSQVSSINGQRYAASSVKDAHRRAL